MFPSPCCHIHRATSNFPHFLTGWSKWNGHCYILIGGDDADARRPILSYDGTGTAGAQCRSMHSKSHLVSIHSLQENSFVTSYIISQKGTFVNEVDTFWIGLLETTGIFTTPLLMLSFLMKIKSTLFADDGFLWEDQTTTDYTNWAFDEPQPLPDGWSQVARVTII